MNSGETKIWMSKKTPATLQKMNPWTQTMSNPKTKRNQRPLKHPHNPFWITAPEINSQKKAAQFPPSVTAPKKQHMKFLISFQKPRSLLCKNSIKPKILCIIYKSVIFMLEKTIKNQDHRLYFLFRVSIGWLTPSNVLPIFNITEHKAVACLVFSR